jgi:hypothetical protein
LKVLSKIQGGVLAGLKTIGQSYRGISNISNRKEEIRIFIIHLPDTNLFYLITIVPEISGNFANEDIFQILRTLKVKR